MRNPIKLELPALFEREGMLDLPGNRSRAGFEQRWFGNLMSIWARAWVQRRRWESGEFRPFSRGVCGLLILNRLGVWVCAVFGNWGGGCKKRGGWVVIRAACVGCRVGEGATGAGWACQVSFPNSLVDCVLTRSPVTRTLPPTRPTRRFPYRLETWSIWRSQTGTLAFSISEKTYGRARAYQDRVCIGGLRLP
jgi:hypothetical protein